MITWGKGVARFSVYEKKKTMAWSEYMKKGLHAGGCEYQCLACYPLTPNTTEELFCLYKHRGFFELKIIFDHLYYAFCGEMYYF